MGAKAWERRVIGVDCLADLNEFFIYLDFRRIILEQRLDLSTSSIRQCALCILWDGLNNRHDDWCCDVGIGTI